MGEVYRARDTRLDRAVAVKILVGRRISSSPEARERFEREARTISQLSHPHICALFDVGEAPNPPVPSPLSESRAPAVSGHGAARGRDAGRSARERRAAARADAAATRSRSPTRSTRRTGRAIVHRDLKPANVMVTRSGVKLLDFGLAKAAAPLIPSSVSVAETTPHVRPLTAQGAIAGTVQYMAPEQLEGRPADARSDIFAFGAVIYEMASGQRGVYRDGTHALSPRGARLASSARAWRPIRTSAGSRRTTCSLQLRRDAPDDDRRAIPAALSAAPGPVDGLAAVGAIAALGARGRRPRRLAARRRCRNGRTDAQRPSGFRCRRLRTAPSTQSSNTPASSVSPDGIAASPSQRAAASEPFGESGCGRSRSWTSKPLAGTDGRDVAVLVS